MIEISLFKGFYEREPFIFAFSLFTFKWLSNFHCFSINLIACIPTAIFFLWWCFILVKFTKYWANIYMVQYTHIWWCCLESEKLCVLVSSLNHIFVFWVPSRCQIDNKCVHGKKELLFAWGLTLYPWLLVWEIYCEILGNLFSFRTHSPPSS